MKFKIIEKSRFLNPEDLDSAKGGCSDYYCPTGGPYTSCSSLSYGICGNGSFTITPCANMHISCGPLMWYQSCSLTDTSQYISCAPIIQYG